MFLHYYVVLFSRRSSAKIILSPSALSSDNAFSAPPPFRVLSLVVLSCRPVVRSLSLRWVGAAREAYIKASGRASQSVNSCCRKTKSEKRRFYFLHRTLLHIVGALNRPKTRTRTQCDIGKSLKEWRIPRTSAKSQEKGQSSTSRDGRITVYWPFL